MGNTLILAGNQTPSRHVTWENFTEPATGPTSQRHDHRKLGLADADDGIGLPEALIHADLTPPNAVPRGDQPPVIIDWIGVGRGPRVWPLAFLLFAAGPRGARRGLDRYTRSISLSEEELRRLPGMLITRPLALDLWSVAHERMTVQQSITRCHAHQARAEAVAAALHDPDRPGRYPHPHAKCLDSPATAAVS